MSNYSYFQRICLLLGIALLACRLGGEPVSNLQATKVAAAVFATQTAVASDVTSPTATPGSGNVTPTPISNMEELKQAVVRLEVEGNFVEPEGYRLLQAGSGSAFIIDPSGLAVTNNHVVAGASLVKVWLDGAEEPRFANVIGLSECDDLAVIQIEGEHYPYLSWYQDSFGLQPEVKVYAAGFPWNNPKLTVTRGVFLDHRSFVPTAWAAVNEVIVHDALLKGGNSGGPLVTEQGQIIGVNYAQNSETGEGLAVASNEASDVVMSLKGGATKGFGISGIALSEGRLRGVWVRAIQPGSLADQAGIEPGDVLTQLDGVRLTIDGSLARYCHVVRRHTSDEVIDFQLIRSTTNKHWAGQINGNGKDLSTPTSEPCEPTRRFEEPFITNRNGWDVGLNESGSAMVTKEITSEETYQVSAQFKRASATWTVIPHVCVKNFKLGFDATIRMASTTGIFGITVTPRYQDEFNYYVVRFGQSGTLMVDQYINDDWQRVIYDRFWETRLRTDETNHFEVVLQDSTLTLSLNGEQFLTTDDLASPQSRDFKRWVDSVLKQTVLAHSFTELLFQSKLGALPVKLPLVRSFGASGVAFG